MKKATLMLGVVLMLLTSCSGLADDETVLFKAKDLERGTMTILRLHNMHSIGDTVSRPFPGNTYRKYVLISKELEVK